MSDFLDRVRSQVLGEIANGGSASAILAEICTAFERHVPNTTAGVTILDRTLQIFEHAIFPSLSPEYGAALQGIAVADRPGSCALAVYEGTTVFSPDVAEDVRFSPLWKELGVAHGLRALVSIPATHRDGLVLGTFVVAYPPEGGMLPERMVLADELAGLCGLVLTYRRNQLKHELLIGELQHRTRNLFSAIGAVVYSTLKSHPEPEAFRKAFDGRLTALARAHSLALEPNEAELRELLVQTLAPYSIDHDVSIEGPRVILTQEAAVAFSLAAHELATNAAKYGALSRNGGAVRIDWDFTGVGDLSEFAMTWTESGGPEVQEPKRQGFGERTLKRSLASAIDARVDLDYRREGLLCSIRAPQSPRFGQRMN